MYKYVAASLASLLLLTAPVARADELRFVFHDLLGSDNFSFNLPSTNPTPSFYQPTSNTGFFVNGVVGGTPEAFEVYFYNSVYSGGLSADDLADGGSFYFQNGFGQYDLASQTYQQIYSGQESSPTFSPGNFILYAQDPETFESSGLPEGTLTVTAVSAAPEPSSWLLMIAGIGGLGLMLRRAKKTMGFRFKDALSA